MGFFHSLDEKEFAELLSMSSLHSYEDGYVLYYENTPHHDLFFLVEGLARAYKMDKYDNETFLYYIYPDSLISEITDLGSETIESFSNVEIVEDAQIVHIDFRRFKKQFLQTNRLCPQMSEEILKRTRQMQSLINREFVFDAVEKVAMMLCSDLSMFNKLKRHDIALMLHIQPATLSRVLNKFKRDNLITIDHGHVSVTDFAALGLLYKEKTGEKD